MRPAAVSPSSVAIVLLALFSLLGGTTALASNPVLATYYVSNSGNDSNNGTSPSTPWKTLAKLNTTKPAPGSAAYLQCGSVFRESLWITNSGTATAPISYGSYGSCNATNLPVVNGADLLASWTTVSEGGFAVYYAAEASAPAVVFENNHRLAAASSASAMTPGSFFYDSVNLLVYVRTIEDTPPVTDTIEASVRPDPVSIQGANYINISGIEADKATQNDIHGTMNLTNVRLTGTVTNYSSGNGIWFSTNAGQTQNNILIQNCVANYNGEDGIEKGGAGNNFVIQGCTTNYNAFDTQYTYTGGIRFISSSSGLYRPTNSGAIGNTAAFNGVNPDTGVALANNSTGQQGTGVWCDTCGNGSFLTGNIAHDNAINGVLLEFTGATGSLTMSYNIAYKNGWAGIVHSRSSHNDVVSNNTGYDNWYNCLFQGQFGGGDTTIGMVNNTYENNICASQVSGVYGVAAVMQFGAENNNLGTGSGNIYSNNSFGLATAATGYFVIFGSGNVLKTYAALDAAYGSSTNSMQLDPMLANPAGGNFALLPGSPAIGAGVGGLDLGAVAFAAAATGQQ